VDSLACLNHTLMVMIWICVAGLGACFGSFLNVVIYRLPRERSIVWPGSSCPACGAAIRWYDNVPIFSFLVLRGRCRHCKTKISFRYPAVEASALAITLLVYWLFGLTFAALTTLFLTLLMVAVAIIDVEHMVIPDELSLGGIVLGLGFSFLPKGVTPLEALIGGAAGAAVLGGIRWVHMKISGVEGMGLGDVKLAGAMGAFLGWRPMPLVFFISAVSGLLVGGGYILIRRRGARTPIPFGAFLALGTVLYAMTAPLWAQYFEETWMM